MSGLQGRRRIMRAVIPESEAALMREVKKYLEWRKHMILYWRNNVGGGFFRNRNSKKERWVEFGGGKGMPDIMAIKRPDGHFIGIELKGPGGVQSPEQRAVQERIESYGGTYILARTLSDIMEVLE